MNRMRLGKYGHALACLVLGGLAISLTGIKSQAADKVRVGLSAISLANSPMWIAEEKQIFKKYDIEQQLIVVGAARRAR
jgi:ABC-type nitrate/sulfonate/bicarbonate transport system substrate-binding protein